MHPRWRRGCATSPIQFQGQFRLLECAADGGILSGAYQCCKKCTPFDAQLTRFYIRVIRVRDVKWSAWQQLNYLRWISQSVSPLIILSLAGRSDQKNHRKSQLIKKNKTKQTVQQKSINKDRIHQKNINYYKENTAMFEHTFQRPQFYSQSFFKA